jgi:hypothetical protein
MKTAMTRVQRRSICLGACALPQVAVDNIAGASPEKENIWLVIESRNITNKGSRNVQQGT